MSDHKSVKIESILTGNGDGSGEHSAKRTTLGSASELLADFRNRMKASVAMDSVNQTQANDLRIMRGEFQLLATTGGLYVRPEVINQIREQLGELDPKIFEKISRRSRVIHQEEESLRRVTNARLRRLVELQRQRDSQLEQLQGNGGFGKVKEEGGEPSRKRRRSGGIGAGSMGNVLGGFGGLSGMGSPSLTVKERRAIARQYENTYISIWKDLSRKDGPKAYRQFVQSSQARQINERKTGQLAARESRRWQVKTMKSLKDQSTKARRSMREMQNFWKRNEREEKMQQVRAEQEAIARAKHEEEERENRRQARKLDFLINQTELYSHFIGNKLKGEDKDGKKPANGSTASASSLNFETDTDDRLHEAAAANAHSAVEQARERAQQFNGTEMNFQNPPSAFGAMSVPQPKILDCTLKEYQKKGLNWLVSLYEQGINGILADEMGLGKTVQSISVLAYLAETYNIWGPFLVVTPASTLHNWQQEITKFVPDFKVLPYWGNAKDRRILRKFWDRKSIVYHKDSPFHVIVTSYQLAVADSQYFQKMRWQYMILDEAQAIKSSQSSRWRSLLSFQCRNRLLLTGTPIQNNMQELWALLHFIMPSLFDSHDEFSEWFSKDIESHAQDHTKLDQLQLQRLHAILKPFMLRRVKKNVQSELGDKIEVDVYCQLTRCQKRLYQMLRSQVNIEDLIESNHSIHGSNQLLQQATGNSRNHRNRRKRHRSQSPDGHTSSGFDYDESESGDSLMNVVMQFRKVCNHPDLFQRADTKSAFVCGSFAESGSLLREANQRTPLELSYSTQNEIQVSVPRLVYDELLSPGENNALSDRRLLARTLLNIWTAENVFSGDSMRALRLLDGLSADQICTLVRQNFIQRAISLRSYRGWLPGEQKRRIKEMYGKSKFSLDIFDHNNPFLRKVSTVRKNCYQKMYLADTKPCYFDSCRAPPVELNCHSQRFTQWQKDRLFDSDMIQGFMPLNLDTQWDLYSHRVPIEEWPKAEMLPELMSNRASHSTIRLPSMERFILDSGKLKKLDQMLPVLKKNGHKCLMYFQMTKMMDLMEEYLTYRQYRYIRLDGSSRLGDRRDLVDDWQTNPDLFIFLLSTRAGGLGINLTAADTVIFYDSDWNPTIDSQAMDRAHRLGQTRQVTVYRLLVKGTIEERMRDRAKQKEQVQKVVMGGSKMDHEEGKKKRKIEEISNAGDSDKPSGTTNIDGKGKKPKNKKEMAMWLLQENDDSDK